MAHNVDLSKPIPPEWRVRVADSYLHSIGLSLFQPKSQTNRRLLYHPLLVFIVFMQQICKNLFIIYMNLSNIKLPDEVHEYLGNVDNILGTGLTLNTCLLMSSLLCISCQIIHYYNYRNGIKPTDLRVFHMISGFISPKSIGINDMLLVQKLLKICKYLLMFIKISINFSTLIAALFCFICLSMNSNLFICIANTILYAILVKHVMNIVCYQTVYYFIITYYIESKIKSINKLLLLNLNRHKVSINISFYRHLFEDLNAIYVEISEYNANYWAKYLAIIWVTFTVNISCFSYVLIFVSNTNDIILQFLDMFGVLNFLIALLFVIYISSQLYIEANVKTYNILNSVTIKNKMPIFIKLQVS